MSSVWNQPYNGLPQPDKDTALEQYKIYLQMADRISDRRTHANNFFVTLNSTLITVYGLASAKKSLAGGPWLWIIPVAGLLVCILWKQIVRSYKNLNGIKFRVVHEIEENLPLALFKHEWDLADHGSGKAYRPTSHIEGWVPLVFGLLFLVFLLFQAAPLISHLCLCK